MVLNIEAIRKKRAFKKIKQFLQLMEKTKSREVYSFIELAVNHNTYKYFDKTNEQIQQMLKQIGKKVERTFKEATKLERKGKEVLLFIDKDGLVTFAENKDDTIAQTEFKTKKVKEGRRKLRQHYVIERNPTIVKEAKQGHVQRDPLLHCEVCGFSFPEKYGTLGAGFIEAHHKKPISEMREDAVTNIEDLALICANCHRMIHLKKPCLKIEELKQKIKKV